MVVRSVTFITFIKSYILKMFTTLHRWFIKKIYNLDENITIYDLSLTGRTKQIFNHFGTHKPSFNPSILQIIRMQNWEDKMYQLDTLQRGLIYIVAIHSNFTCIPSKNLHVPKVCHRHYKLVLKEKWLSCHCFYKGYSSWVRIELLIRC